MNTEDFLRLGVPLGEATRRATDFVAKFILWADILKIPRGFQPSAQGCEERATLGSCEKQITTLKELRPCGSPAHRKNEDTTHVGVVRILKCEPKVAPVAQPWAE
ncbi:MAG: hypothetical protein ABSE90_04015 [Verrucomicrobiota bacterium]|jgi:hypothetical protein